MIKTPLCILALSLGLPLRALAQPAPEAPDPSAIAVLPLSARLLQLKAPSLWSGSFAGTQVERAGLTVVDSRFATGLDLAVSGSDRATALALDSHRELVRGNVLYFTGMGVIIASLVAVLASTLAVSSTSANSATAQSLTPELAAGTAGVVVGGIVALIGVPFLSIGLREQFDAVNTYNADLVDDRLRLPPSEPLPQG